MQVRPITTLTREEVAELARNAADNDVPLPVANVFPQGSEQAAWFNQTYWERDWALRSIEA